MHYESQCPAKPFEVSLDARAGFYYVRLNEQNTQKVLIVVSWNSCVVHKPWTDKPFLNRREPKKFFVQ